MKIDSSPPKRISRLPAEITMEIDGVDKPVVSFARHGQSCPIKLKVIKNPGKQVTVLLPESLADWGPGIYDVVVTEGCEECDRVSIEFLADCKITSVDVKETDDCETNKK